MEYTRRCGPLKTALEKMHELEREIEENDRLQKEKEKEVRIMIILHLCMTEETKMVFVPSKDSDQSHQSSHLLFVLRKHAFAMNNLFWTIK